MKTPKAHGGDGNLAISTAHSFFALAGTFFETIPDDLNARAKFLIEHRGMLIAATTNLVFAVELLLKGVALKTLGRAYEGHRLIERFDELPLDVRESIESCYRYRIDQDAGQKFPAVELGVSPVEVDSSVMARAHRLNRPAGEDVRSLLESEKDAFQLWRYFYEQADPRRPVCATIHWYRLGVLVNAIQDQFVPPHERPNFPRPS